jgi:ADP-ribose pyrophosphatase YjhB (NUDIX family)
MKVQKIPFAEFKKIYSRVPRLCVEVVLIRDDSLLLIRRTIPPAIGFWHTPGGTVLKGEDLHKAVKRVAAEELGIKIEILKFIGVIEYKSYINHYSQDISLAFLVKTDNKKEFKLDGHADKYAFFSSLPKNTILDQKEFYKKNLKINTLNKVAD